MYHLAGVFHPYDCLEDHETEVVAEAQFRRG